MADSEHNQNADNTVDDAPISPLERKNSLENHLAHRPDRSTLVDSMFTLVPASHFLPRPQPHFLSLTFCFPVVLHATGSHLFLEGETSS